MSTTLSTSRRRFLAAGGYIALAFSIPVSDLSAQVTPQTPARPRLPGNLNNHRLLKSWLRINADGTVTLLVGKVELGQGILTAVAQICADELDVNFDRVRIISGDTAQVPNEGVTAGSFSMPDCAPAVQQASAEVRALLIEMAAARLGKPVDSLKVTDGSIRSGDGASISYWQLASGLSLEREASGAVKTKPIGEHRYIGKSVPRIDLPAKLTGQPIFIQDLRPKGVVYGQVVRPPTYKARLASIDTSAVEKMPGVIKVVRNGAFLGVVAQRQEQAIAAAGAVAAAARWEVEKALPGHDGMERWLRETKPARVIDTRKTPRSGGAAPAKVIEATYYRPYQMHASIGT